MDPRQTVDRILQRADVGDIFMAGNLWLETHSFEVVDGWIRRYPDGRIRHSDEFRRASDPLNRVLNPAAAVRTTLNATVHRALRDRVYQLLRISNSPSEFGAVVLALLVAIDERFGARLRADYYRREDAMPSAVPLTYDKPLPKPWPAFGTGLLPLTAMAPATEISKRQLFLEHQFARLIMPHAHAAAKGNQQPALHPSGQGSIKSDATSWVVAAVDLLASINELELGGDDDPDHFWISRYSREDVEEEIGRRLDWALERCRMAGAQFVILPELTLSPALIGRIASELGRWPTADNSGLLPMVVAGQLHQAVDGSPGRFWNRPAVVTPDGSLVWDYWKARPFQAGALNNKIEACAPPSDYVLAIDTPLGRVAPIICLDFLDLHVQTVLRELRVSVVAVPAMTPGRSVRDDFYPRAAALTSACRAATIFSNSSLHIREEIRKGLAVPRTLSFVRGSTAIPANTPACTHEFESPDKLATVLIYRLQSSVGGGLAVSRDPARHLPE